MATVLCWLMAAVSAMFSAMLVFTHTGSGGHKDKLGFAETESHLVKVGKAGRDAGDLVSGGPASDSSSNTLCTIEDTGISPPTLRP